MSREEIEKLLGGHATDTLSETERRALFEAALEDQELFGALAKEQALRDVLDDPMARQQLLAALEPAPEPWHGPAWRWLLRPAPLAVAAGLAALLVVSGVVWQRSKVLQRREVMVAEVKPPAPVSVPPVKQQVEVPKPLPAPPMPRKRSRVTKAVPQPVPAAPSIHAENSAIQGGAPSAASPARMPAVTEQVSVAPAAAPPPVQKTADQSTVAPSLETARQLYSQPNPQASGSLGGRLMATHAKAVKRAGGAPPLASNLGLRYGLILKGADGEYAPVPLDTVFRSGDSVRLRLEPNDSGFLYLFQRDAAGGWRLAASQPVERGQRCFLPATGGFQYDRPGSKELLVVLSRQEQPSFTELGTAQVDALAVNARDKILKAAVSSEESGYAVDTRTPSSQQQVAFEITLQYR